MEGGGDDGSWERAGGRGRGKRNTGNYPQAGPGGDSRPQPAGRGRGRGGEQSRGWEQGRGGQEGRGGQQGQGGPLGRGGQQSQGGQQGQRGPQGPGQGQPRPGPSSQQQWGQSTGQHAQRSSGQQQPIQPTEPQHHGQQYGQQQPQQYASQQVQRPAWGQQPQMQVQQPAGSSRQPASSLVPQGSREVRGQPQPQPSTSSMAIVLPMGSEAHSVVHSRSVVTGGGDQAGEQLSQGPPARSLEQSVKTLSLGGQGWLPLPEEKEDIELPIRKGQAKEFSRKIIVAVNHFPLKITLPSNIFQYEVKVERKPRPKNDEVKDKPKSGGAGRRGGRGGGSSGSGPAEKKLPRRILQKILKCVRIYLTNQFETNIKKRIGIASDFSKILNTTERLEPIGLVHSIDMSPAGLAALRIEDPDPEEDENGTFIISLEPTDFQVDTVGLTQHVNNLEGMNDARILVELSTVYNTVVKCMPNHKYMAMGRSLLIKFPPAGDDGRKLGGGLTSWPGISACINPGWKFFLNIELGYSTMREGDTVLGALGKHFGSDASNVTEWTPADVKSGTDFLKTCKIRYNTLPGQVRGGTVQRIDSKPACKGSFVKDNVTLTIEQYFRQQYRVTLQYPNGPLLELSNGSLIPAELCIIKSGQSVNRKLNDTQTREMVSIARKFPNVLEREILDATSKLRLNQNDLFRKFGIQVDEKMLEMQCRVLEAPMISYNNVRGNELFNVAPEKGVWQVWQHNFLFRKPANEQNTRDWGILVFGKEADRNAIRSFSDCLVRFAAKCGLQFNAPQVESRMLSDRDMDQRKHEQNVNVLREVFRTFSNKRCSLVVVVIPFKPSRLYGQVKQAAELSCNGVGIVTQCVLQNNFCPRGKPVQPATIQQLLLKINSKLDGICHTVTLPPSLKGRFDRIDLPNMKEAVLVLGADVTHPPPGSAIKDPKNPQADIQVPSFASVTGSLDRTCMPYMMHVQAQQKCGRGAAEVIPNLGEIVADMIKEFYRRNKSLPAKLIYYRDGVGDGQFKEVLHIEMRGIRYACSQFDKMHGGVPYQPKITFITVQKRHKTRFFMRDGRKTDNAPPGTVVDSKIVHPTEMDFYLLSHQAIQGTSRPTRYHVLWDDSDFTQDEIQILTYFLCHMYVRCNRSVKIPAPTYYAHWAAARAKALAEGNEHLYAEDLRPLNEKIRRETNFKTKFPMHFI